MRYLVAVSGGVDSVVLLDKLVRQHEHGIIVAHFDHGIRPDSAADARFVAALAAQYHLPFVTRRETLGPDASEDVARRRRYAFLHQAARDYGSIIVTAHHADDVIETMAINLSRGTGWRGMAVLDTPGIIRPQLGVSKAQLYDYARDNRLEWVEDSTNRQLTYLRNQLRYRIGSRLTLEQKQAALGIWLQQKSIKARIQVELERCVQDTVQTDQSGAYYRYVFIVIDDVVAYELLRAVVMAKEQPGPTRPQLSRALLAIKTASAGAYHDIGNGLRLRFTKRTFIVETGV